MKINVIFNENGISIIDVLTEDFVAFLDEYINKKINRKGFITK